MSKDRSDNPIIGIPETLAYVTRPFYWNLRLSQSTVSARLLMAANEVSLTANQNAKFLVHLPSTEKI
jgi:hypothetical protein